MVETCKVTQFWNQHRWALGSSSSWTSPLQITDQQHLVVVSDVQSILLGGGQKKQRKTFALTYESSVSVLS